MQLFHLHTDQQVNELRTAQLFGCRSSRPAAARSRIVQRSATTTDTANSTTSTTSPARLSHKAAKNAKHGGSDSRKLCQTPAVGLRTQLISIFHSKPNTLSYFFHDADKVAKQRISKNRFGAPLKPQRTHSPARRPAFQCLDLLLSSSPSGVFLSPQTQHLINRLIKIMNGFLFKIQVKTQRG